MTVVLSYHDEATSRGLKGYEESGRKSAFCGLKVGGYPFVHWDWFVLRGDGEMKHTIICGDCCEGIGPGLMADIVQVRAIRQMKAVGMASQHTLQRVSLDDVRQRHEPPESKPE
jgi:hypothetical protein